MVVLLRDGKLADIIGELSPMQRQAVIDQAMRGGLVSREGATGKLAANTRVAPDFQRLLDDVNAMGPKRSQPLNYDWGAQESIVEKAARTVRELRPGDSARVSGDAGLVVAGLKYDAGAAVDIKREEDGAYRVGFETEVGGGVEATLAANARNGAEMKAQVRLEYRYKSADEAMAAAASVIATQGKNIAALGKPAAVEGEASAVGELMADLGMKKVSVAEVGLEGKLAASMRLELDGKKPQLVVRSSASVEGSASLGLGLEGKEHHGHQDWGFIHGVSAGGGTKLELENRFTLDGEGLIAGPKTKATLSGDLKWPGGVREGEASFELDHGEAALLMAGDLSKLGDVEVELAAKSVSTSSRHLGGFAEHAGFGGGAELSVETRRLESQQKLKAKLSELLE
jgi:hypothetical protein